MAEVIKLNRPFTSEELGFQQDNQEVIKLNRPFTQNELSSTVTSEVEERKPEQEPTVGGIFGRVPLSKYQQGERNILGNVFERPAAAMRSVLLDKPPAGLTPQQMVERNKEIFTKASVNPTQVPTIQNEILEDYYGKLPNFPGKTAAGNLVSAAGYVGDYTASPADLALSLAPGLSGVRKGGQFLRETKPGRFLEKAGNYPLEKIPGRLQEISKQRAIPKLIKQATQEHRIILRPEKGEIKNIEIRQGKNIDDFYELAAEEQLRYGTTPDKKIDTSDARELLNLRRKDLYKKQIDFIKARPERKFDLLEVGEKAKQELSKSIKDDTELKNALKTVDSQIADSIERRGRVVNGEDLINFKEGKWSTSYTRDKPIETAVVPRKLGHIAKEMIEKAYPEQNIKQINELSGKYAGLTHLLENAQGRVIQGGRMGRYFAKTIGAVAGSKIPVAGPIFTILGQWGGGKFSDIINAPELASKIAANKSAKAGIVGRSFKNVMGYEPIFTPEIVRNMPVSKQRLLPFKPILQTSKVKQIQTDVAKKLGLTAQEIRLLPPSNIKYGEEFTARNLRFIDKNKTSSEIQRLKAFIRKGAGEEEIKSLWADIVKKQIQ